MIKDVVIMDTNVILAIYKFSPATINDLINQFEANISLFWISDQVYSEIKKNNV